MQKHLIAALACACSAGATPGYAQNVVSLQPVAPIGSPAPGTPNNFTATALNASISSTGTVSLIATAGTSGVGLWYGTPGNLQLAALSGQTAPGAAGGVFNSAFFTNSPMLAFDSGGGAARLSTSSPTAQGIWSYLGGTTTLEAIQNGPAPGTAFNFVNFSSISYNDLGGYVFASTLSGTSITRGLHANVGLGLTLIATNQTVDPGLSRKFTSFDTTNGSSINNNGLIGFECTLDGNTNTNIALCISAVPSPVGGVTVIAQKGLPAPGTAYLYSNFSGLSLNDDNDAVYRALLDVSAPTNTNSGLWHYDSATSSSSLIALEGDPAPGTANFYGPSFEEWFFANNGSIAFAAETVDATSTPQGRGVWIDPDGVGPSPNTLVAVTGGAAYDKDGVSPLPSVTVTSITNVSMNRNGDLLLRMVLSNGRAGIWIRPEGIGNQAALFLMQSETVYDATRAGRLVSSLTVPKNNNFTSLGGGPIGRANLLSETKEPLVVLSLDSVSSGLFQLTHSPLTFLVSASLASAPGTIGGEFESLRPAGALNENGLVATRGTLLDAVGDTQSGVNEQGIWAEVQGTSGPELQLVARRGDPAPGGGLYGQLLLNPIFNDNGELAFNGDGGPLNTALWKGLPGALTLVQSQGLGNLAILPSGETFGHMRRPISFNNSGRILCALPLTLGSGPSSSPVSPANDTVIVRFGTTPRLIARENELAGTGAARFDHLINAKPVLLNNNSNSVFSASRKLSPANGVNASNQWGIWYHNGTTRSVVAAGSIPANPQNVQGLSGVQFLKPEDPVLNDGNRIAFYSTLTGSVTANVNDVGLFLSNAGTTPAVLVRTGQKQTSGLGPNGIDPDAEFVAFSRPVIGAVGSVPQVLFRANMLVGTGPVTAQNDTALWVHNGTIIRLVAREGSQSTDSSGGLTSTLWNSFDNFTISPGGRVAFVGSLLVGTAGVTANDDNGLWAENSAGQLVLVVREGTSYDIPIAGGGTRNVTIRSIVIPGTPLGGANIYKGYNSAGFLLAHMTFVDGTTASMLFLVP